MSLLSRLLGREECDHIFKEPHGCTIMREDGERIELRLIRCALCGESAFFDHENNIEYQYK